MTTLFAAATQFVVAISACLLAVVCGEATTSWTTVTLNCGDIVSKSTLPFHKCDAANIIWQPFTQYILNNCTKAVACVFDVPLPLVNLSSSVGGGNAGVYGNVNVTISGGNVAARIVATDGRSVANVSSSLRGVALRIDGGSTETHATLGLDKDSVGGVLLSIVAQEWYNISLIIEDSTIVVADGWVFNWTENPKAPVQSIGGIFSLRSQKSVFMSGESVSIIVVNSTVNVSEVVGAATMFYVAWSSSPHASTARGPTLNGVTFRLVASNVTLLVMTQLITCSLLFNKSRISVADQFVFLIAGSGSDSITTLSNVQCTVESSTVRVLFNPQKACRDFSSRTDAAIVQLRAVGIMENVLMQLSGNHELSVQSSSPSSVADGSSVDSFSRTFIVGVSAVDVASNISVVVTSSGKGVARSASSTWGGTTTIATSEATDYTALVMLFRIEFLLSSYVHVGGVHTVAVATKDCWIAGRIAGVVVFELVNFTASSVVVLDHVRSFALTQPGGGSELMAASASLFYVKGGLLNTSVVVTRCNFTCNATGGAATLPMMMVTLSPVVAIATSRAYNVTNSSFTIVDTSIESSVDVRSTSMVSMVTASTALLLLPMTTVGSTVYVMRSSSTVRSAVLSAAIRRSGLGIVVCSVPIPPPSMMNLSTPKVQFPVEQAELIDLLRVTAYRNVTMIITNCSMITVPDVAILASEAAFDGAVIMVAPRFLGSHSHVHIVRCSFQGLADQTNTATYLGTSIVACVGGSTINSSIIQAKDMDTMSYILVSTEGALTLGAGALLHVSNMTMSAQQGSSELSPITAGQSPQHLPSFLQYLVTPVPTNIVLMGGSCVAVQHSVFINYRNMTANTVEFPPTQGTNQGEEVWDEVGSMIASHCGGGDARLALTCLNWTFPSSRQQRVLSEQQYVYVLGRVQNSKAVVRSCGDDTATATATLSSDDEHIVDPPALPNSGGGSVKPLSGVNGAAAVVSVALSVVGGASGAAAANFQVLALMGISPCAPKIVDSASSISKYIVVSPFYDLGDEAQVLGGIGVVLMIAAVQLAAIKFAARREGGNNATISKRDTRGGAAAAANTSFCSTSSAHPDTTSVNNSSSISTDPSHHEPCTVISSAVVSVLRQYPKYTYQVGLLLVPGVWRSSLAILCRGGGVGGVWNSAGGTVVVGVFGLLCVVAACAWRVREGRLIDRHSPHKAPHTTGRRQGMFFKSYRLRVFQDHAVPILPLAAYPTGFWNPHEARDTHEPLRDQIRCGTVEGLSCRRASAIRWMSSYPVTVSLMATTALTFPFAVNEESSGKRAACIASWAALCLIYAAAGLLVVIVRPGRAPLSDLLYATFMGSTLMLDIIVAVQSSTDKESINTALNDVFLTLSFLCTAAGVVNMAHQLFIGLWERHVLLQQKQQPLPAIDDDEASNTRQPRRMVRTATPLLTPLQSLHNDFREEVVSGNGSFSMPPSKAANTSTSSRPDVTSSIAAMLLPKAAVAHRVTVPQIEQLENLIGLICNQIRIGDVDAV